MAKKIKFESYKYLFLRKISQKIIEKNIKHLVKKINQLEFIGTGDKVYISLNGVNILEATNSLMLYKKEINKTEKNIKKYNDDLINNDVTEFLRLIENE